MIAVYTGHQDSGGEVRQDQRIAYSLDNGRTWTKYSDNPVIDEDMADFRDPKVFWHEASEKWVMSVALSKEQKIRFYGSDNLKEWSLLSEFGPSGAADNLLWECPDLFELSVDGNPDQTKWVLQVDVNPGSVAGGSGGQYFIGDFDGRQFEQDPATKAETLWVDYGRDFYAAQSYSDIPENDGRRIWLAWMNNWDYAQKIPTDPWRSAMTIPREVTIRNTDRGFRLIQKPVQELQQLRGNHIEIEQTLLRPDGSIELPDFNGKAYELIAKFDAGDAEEFGIKVRQGGDEQTVIGYDVKKQHLFLDRRNSGEIDFDTTFASLDQAPLALENNRIRLHIFVDWSSVEIFANDGEVVITDRIFPSPESNNIEFFSEGGTAKLLAADIWELESVWKKSEN